VTQKKASKSISPRFSALSAAVVVPPGRTLRVDAFGNFEILFK
jgi:hypothetical protein